MGLKTYSNRSGKVEGKEWKVTGKILQSQGDLFFFCFLNEVKAYFIGSNYLWLRSCYRMAKVRFELRKGDKKNSRCKKNCPSLFRRDSGPYKCIKNAKERFDHFPKDSEGQFLPETKCYMPH